MKIVSVMTTSAYGGAEFAARELLAALAERGHEVVLLTNESRFSGTPGLHVREIELGPKLGRSTWPRLLLGWRRHRRGLKEALQSELPYDVLLLHYKKEQLLAGGLDDSLTSGLVWAEWGPLPRQMRKGLPGRLYLAAARRVRAVIAVSEATKASLFDVGLPSENVTVVPSALSGESVRFDSRGREEVRRRLGIPSDAFVVGCLSRLDANKRNDVLVDAVALLEANVRLLIAGEGEAEGALRARAAPLGERAHFVPPPTDDLAALVSAFDLAAVCPAPSEGEPRSALMAMLAGRPCVATSDEGLTELVGDGVGAVASRANDVAAFADCIRAYSSDPTRLARESARARERALSGREASVVADQVERVLMAAAAPSVRP